jgi:hypothetical protein
MRAAKWTAALIVGLFLASNARAQTLTSLSANNSAPTSSPGVGVSTFLRTMTQMRFFSTGGYPQTAKPQTPPRSGIPDPSTPAYFQAFGYQRLTPPLSTADRLLLFFVSRTHP